MPVDHNPPIAPVSPFPAAPPLSPPVRFDTHTPSMFADNSGLTYEWLEAVGITQSNNLSHLTTPKAQTVRSSEELIANLHASVKIPRFLFDEAWPLSCRDSIFTGVAVALEELKDRPREERLCDDDPDNVKQKWEHLCNAYKLIKTYIETEADFSENEVRFRGGLDALFDIVFSLTKTAFSDSKLTYNTEVNVGIIQPMDPQSNVARPGDNSVADGLLLADISDVFLDNDVKKFLGFNKHLKPERFILGAAEYKLTKELAATNQLYFDLSAGSAVLHLVGVKEPIIGVTVTNKIQGATVYVACWFLEDGQRYINMHRSKITYPINNFVDFLFFHSFLCKVKKDIVDRLIPQLEAVQVEKSTLRYWQSSHFPRTQKESTFAIQNPRLGSVAK